MSTAWSRRRRAALVLTAGAFLTGPLPLRALASGIPMKPDVRLPAPGDAERLRGIVAALASRSGARLLLDPEIEVTLPAKEPDAQLPLDGALNVLCASLRGVAWRRVYLPPRALAESLAAPALLASVVRALEEPAPDRLVSENVAGKRTLLFLRERPATTAFPAEWQSRYVGTEPVYLLYAIQVSARTRVSSQLAELQRQQLTLPVPPEKVALAMVQMMQLLQALPPEQAEAFAGRVGQSSMRLWESTPPRQRDAMLQQTLQVMQRFGALGGAAAPAGSPRARPTPPTAPPGNVTASLKAAAAALGKRHDVTVLIDPALTAASPPPELDAELSLVASLDALLAGETGLAWRRLHVPVASRKHYQRADGVASLAESVRMLEALTCDTVIVENAVTRRATILVAGAAVSATTLDAEKFATEPIYLIYSTTPATGGATAEQRFAALQRRQMGLLLQMDPGQLARSMEQLVLAFDAADTGTRARLIGLPLSAAMMAVWFPQAAKERQRDE